MSNLRRLEDVDLWRLEDVWLKTSSRRLFYDILRTSNLQRLEDVWLYDILRTPDLRRLKDVRFTSSWECPIYNVFKTSDLHHPEDVWFTTFWRRLIYIVLKRSYLRCLEDVQFTMSSRRLQNNVCEATSSWRLYNVKRNVFSWFCTVWNIQKILSVPI